MATRVGTSATGQGDAASPTIASSAKSTTTGNFLTAFVKGEAGFLVNSVADTAGNTWALAAQLNHPGSGEPMGSLWYAANITGHASNVVTATFAGSATYRRIIYDQWSGVATSSPLDASAVTNSGNSATYSTGAITTTTTGLVVAGVAGYTGLTFTAGGTPTFTAAATVSDTFSEYLISGSAQTVTPGATGSASNLWVMVAAAFKDAAGGAIQLTVAAATSVTNAAAPAVVQQHALTAATASTATALTGVALTQTHQLATANCASATEASSGVVSQAHQLAASGATSATALSTVAIDSAVALVAASMSSATTLSTLGLAQQHNLSVGNASSATASSAAAVVQQHALTVDAAQTVSTVSAVTLGSGVVELTVDNSACNTALSSPSLEMPSVSLGGRRNRWGWSWQDLADAQAAQRSVHLAVAPMRSATELRAVKLRVAQRLQVASSTAETALSDATLSQWRRDQGLFRSVGAMPLDAQAFLHAQIERAEAGQPRALRELALAADDLARRSALDRLTGIEREIAALRERLVQSRDARMLRRSA